jgi:nitroimidazol reductase NimA-like FMN-containing flavoprotein (pyridoxamine 5'-phosphate oxidase superfamily)
VIRPTRNEPVLRSAGGATVGRLGVVVDGTAEIFPVNYLLDRTTGVLPTILLRTDPGTKLTGLARDPHVTFEVDSLDPTDQTGWSIVVKGRAQQTSQMVDPDQRHRFERMPVRHWYVGPKRHTIRIVPTEVTGRRIKRTATTALTELPSIAEWSGRPVWIPPTRSSLAEAS